MLTLPIKQEWFDMICRGEKREEYREATEYYRTRINSAIVADPNCKGQAYKIDDIDFAERTGQSMGDDEIDRPDWYRFRKFLESETKRRGEPCG